MLAKERTTLCSNAFCEYRFSFYFLMQLNVARSQCNIIVNTINRIKINEIAIGIPKLILLDKIHLVFSEKNKPLNASTLPQHA